MAFKIFPATIIDGQKIPLIRGWKDSASNDPAQIRIWQELFRDRIKMWGIPTGSVNGIFALDIDVKKVNGWKSIEALGYILPNTMSQKTPSGGAHLLFKTRPGIHHPNTVNTELGLDTRGESGWIAHYSLDQTPIADAPEWIFDLAKKKPAVTPTGATFKLAPEIAEVIVKESIDSIINAPQGQSNDTLNTESFKIGQLVAAGSISREFAETELFKAAKQRGKPDYEARATIKSGLDGGVKNPLVCPFPSEAPTPIIPVTAPVPETPQRWTPNYLTRHDLLNTSKLRKPQLFSDWSTEDIHITTADGGTGKTTLKLYEAICLALGDRFLGFENKQRGKTLFITGEDTDKKLAAMLGAIMRQMGLFEEGIENDQKVQIILDSIVIKKDADLCLISKDKAGFLAPSADAFRKLKEAVDDIKPKMIVFDPIASFWGSEAMLNDMNKAVTKFMGWLVDISGACVEMINHMGKSSSANKDMTQFAGRGGTGLPSNSRVSRVLRAIDAEEFRELTGMELVGDQTAMVCNVNKFSDGSVLFNKPFVIVREGYLFKRITLTVGKAKEMEQKMTDMERVFEFVKEERTAGRYPIKSVIIGHFKNNSHPISKVSVESAISMIQYNGFMGEKFRMTDHPDLSIREKAIIIVDSEGREIT